MLKESQIFNYWDIVYSCFVPHEMLDVYMAVGFKNRSHFSSAFKRQFGVSPGEVGTVVHETDLKIPFKCLT